MTNALLDWLSETVEILCRNIVVIILSKCIDVFTETFKFFLALLLVFAIGYLIFLFDNGESGPKVVDPNATDFVESEDASVKMLDVAVIEDESFSNEEGAIKDRIVDAPKAAAPAAPATSIDEKEPAAPSGETTVAPSDMAAAEPAAETAAKLAAETTAKPAAETADEPVAETATKPVAEADAKPAAEAIAETAAEPADEAAAEPDAETVSKPVVEAAGEKATEPAPQPSAQDAPVESSAAPSKAASVVSQEKTESTSKASKADENVSKPTAESAPPQEIEENKEAEEQAAKADASKE